MIESVSSMSIHITQVCGSESVDVKVGTRWGENKGRNVPAVSGNAGGAYAPFVNASRRMCCYHFQRQESEWRSGRDDCAAVYATRRLGKQYIVLLYVLTEVEVVESCSSWRGQGRKAQSATRRGGEGL